MEMTKETFENKCYEAYQLEWMISHGYTLNDLYTAQLEYMQEMFDPSDFSEEPFDESDLERAMMQGRDMLLFEQGLGGGSIFVCKDEFLGAEYLDTDYMNTLLSLMPNSKKMKELYREYTGKSVEQPKELSVKTTAGEIKAYKSTDPGNPGIGIEVIPTGYDTPIDIARVLTYEDYDYRTSCGENPEDIVLLTYTDPANESYTDKVIITREEIVKAIPESERSKSKEISFEMLLMAYRQGIVRLIESEYATGVVCQIGSTDPENFFFFGQPGAYEDATVEEVLEVFSEREICDKIWKELNEMKADGNDDYDIFYAAMERELLIDGIEDYEEADRKYTDKIIDDIENAISNKAAELVYETVDGEAVFDTCEIRIHNPEPFMSIPIKYDHLEDVLLSVAKWMKGYEDGAYMRSMVASYLK